MSIDNIVALLTFLASAIAVFFSIRKQGREGKNIDADTIDKLYTTIERQEVRYENLKRDFEEYKLITTAQVASIAQENVRLRNWANRLVKQLEDAQIIPYKFE